MIDQCNTHLQCKQATRFELPDYSQEFVVCSVLVNRAGNDAYDVQYMNRGWQQGHPWYGSITTPAITTTLN